MIRRVIREKDGSAAVGYAISGGLTLDHRLINAWTEVGRPLLAAGRLAPAGSTPEVQYTVTGETLAERLCRPFSGAQACALMERISQLIDTLTERGMPLMNVRLAADEVYMDGDTGACCFVFLPVTGITPDLRTAADFFRSIGRKLVAADYAASAARSSYIAFFQVPGPFDVMGFSTHLKQVVASVSIPRESTAPVVDGAAAAPGAWTPAPPEPTEAPGDDEGTTVLSEPEAAYDDLGTTVLAEEEGDDAGTTLLGLDEDADTGTTVLDDEEEDEVSILQSRPDRTGVLDAIDFQVAEGYEDLFAEDVLDRAAEAPHASAPGPQPKVGPEPEPALEPTPAAKSVIAPVGRPVSRPESEEPIEQPAAAAATPVSEEPVEAEAVASPEPEEPAEQPTGAEDAEEPVDQSAEAEAVATSAPAPAEPVHTAPSAPAPAPSRFFLTRLSTGERFEVRGRRFVVGKSKHSSFQVKGTTTVSRSHAIFITTPATCTITDDDSRNGTFINNQEIFAGEPAELVDGDTVRMSDELFAFEVQPA